MTASRRGRAKIQLPREPMISLVQEAAKPRTSFHRSLQECAKSDKKEQSPRIQNVARVRSWAKLFQQGAFGFLTRSWSWFHNRYGIAATKRLRVAETVSLGEKRFVALVNVDGREFLIGGGTSGVSLLAQWRKGRKTADQHQPELDEEGNFK